MLQLDTKQPHIFAVCYSCPDVHGMQEIRQTLLKWPQSHYASAAAAVADDHKPNLALVAAVPLQMHQQPGSFTLHCWCMHLMTDFASWCFGSCLSSCLLLIS